MNKEKEMKFKKILQEHKDKGIISKKKYKKELEFIKALKEKNGKNN